VHSNNVVVTVTVLQEVHLQARKNWGWGGNEDVDGLLFKTGFRF